MQELVVGLIVLAAAVYLAAKYLPRALRVRLVVFLQRRGWLRVAGWFDKAAGDACGGGCNSCSPAAPPLEPPGKHRVIKLHQRR